MHEPLYILTTAIPKSGEFEVYLKDIGSGQIKMIKKGLVYKRYRNIPSILQFFIENKIYPLSVYDSKLNSLGSITFNTFEKIVSQRCMFMDINFLQDGTACISYGNPDFITLRFNGKKEIENGENYVVYFQNNEEELIKKFLVDIEQSPDLFLCGYNITGFDLKYIKTRAEVYGILNKIESQPTNTLFKKRKIYVLPNFVNIDLLPILEYAALPSTKLENVSKFFGLEKNKISKDSTIQKNVSNLIITSEILKKILYPIYLLSEKTMGSFHYAFYSNLPRNVMVRSVFDYYKNYTISFKEILGKIDEEIKKFSFDLDQEKIKDTLEVKFSGTLERSKLLDLAPRIAEKLKILNPVFERLLKTYESIENSSVGEKISKRMISDIIYRILSNMKKNEAYRSRIYFLIEEAKKEMKGKVYCSSEKYLIFDGAEDRYSFNLRNVILHSEKPKIFLANLEGIPIGSIPKKPINMPVEFYESFLQDLFDLSLGKPAGRMKGIKEKLDKGGLCLDDLKIEVKEMETFRFPRDSKNNFGKNYVVKIKKGLLPLEEARKESSIYKDLDMNYYKKEFLKLWKICEKIEQKQSSLEDF